MWQGFRDHLPSKYRCLERSENQDKHQPRSFLFTHRTRQRGWQQSLLVHQAHKQPELQGLPSSLWQKSGIERACWARLEKSEGRRGNGISYLDILNAVESSPRETSVLGRTSDRREWQPHRTWCRRGNVLGPKKCLTWLARAGKGSNFVLSGNHPQSFPPEYAKPFWWSG